MKKFMLNASVIAMLAGPLSAHAGWLSDFTGINIEPGKPITIGPPDPINSTAKAIENLPKTLAELPGVPLAEAIRQGRNRAYPGATPMPAHIRQALAPYFPPQILNKVRYTTDWGAAANGTLQQLIMGGGHASAVTLEDVIVFRDGRLVDDLVLWAHELTHVEQYDRMGTDTFANQYTLHAWILENQATDKANNVDTQLAYEEAHDQYDEDGYTQSQLPLPSPPSPFGDEDGYTQSQLPLPPPPPNFDDYDDSF